MINNLIERIIFWNNADRIGPSIPITYWRIFLKKTMIRLCQKKFKYFHETAEVRPGVHIVGCSKISVGKRVVIRPGSFIYSDTCQNSAIIIDDNVLLGPGIHIYNDNHAYKDVNKEIIDQGYDKITLVHLKKGCWIGAGTIILAGVIIGRHSVIGAGSVVTRNIPDFCVAVGNPAKVIKEYRFSKKRWLKK